MLQSEQRRGEMVIYGKCEYIFPYHILSGALPWLQQEYEEGYEGNHTHTNILKTNPRINQNVVIRYRARCLKGWKGKTFFRTGNYAKRGHSLVSHTHDPVPLQTFDIIKSEQLADYACCLWSLLKCFFCYADTPAKFIWVRKDSLLLLLLWQCKGDHKSLWFMCAFFRYRVLSSKYFSV